MVTTPSITTLPGNALIDGPRTVRDRPDTIWYADWKISCARASGSEKYSLGPVSRSTNI